MRRVNAIVAVFGAVLLLLPLLALPQKWPMRPWDEPVVCPNCQSDRVVYIIYGEPKLDDDLKRALQSHKVEFGGCLITPASKRWECRRCGYGWGDVGRATNNPPQ